MEPTSFYKELGIVLYDYVEKTLRDTQDIDVKTLKPHMQKYIAWLKKQISNSGLEQRSDAHTAWASCTQDAESMELMISRIANTNMEGKLLVSIGQNLESILRGDSDPPDILFRNELMNVYYGEVCNKISNCRQLRGWLDAIAHKNPCMKVIEIGAGNGSITSLILESLQLHGHAADGATRFAQYDYTDISGAFFEHVQEKFGSAKAKMNFKILNIEKDPASQGYEEGSYDLVVAAWVLHATPDLVTTVRNVRKLLKPLGKLVLLEVTRPNILRSGLAFGLLPGWWLSAEKHREWSPLSITGAMASCPAGRGFLRRGLCSPRLPNRRLPGEQQYDRNSDSGVPQRLSVNEDYVCSGRRVFSTSCCGGSCSADFKCNGL